MAFKSWARYDLWDPYLVSCFDRTYYAVCKGGKIVMRFVWESDASLHASKIGGHVWKMTCHRDEFKRYFGYC